MYDHSNIKILTENKKSTKYASSKIYNVQVCLIKIHTIYNLTAIQKDTKQLLNLKETALGQAEMSNPVLGNLKFRDQ